MPILTFIVPCFNSQDYVKETIESIKSQKLHDFECIIVNDGSTDKSAEIIGKEIEDDNRFLLVNTENKGVASARNLALQMASGKYILPIDSDDIVMGDYAYDAVNFLEENDDFSLYYGAIQISGQTSFVVNVPYKDYQTMLYNDCLCVSGVYRRDKAIEIGGYNTSLIAMEDFDFWIRYLYHNDNIKFSEKVGFIYRKRINSRHSTKTQLELARTRVEIMRLNKKIYAEYNEGKNRRTNPLPRKRR
jgi:glycosyltransferase involved in cell wall biosynthesis